MDLSITKLSSNAYSFKLDRLMYSREAVLNASYKFLDKAFFKFGASDDNYVELVIMMKEACTTEEVQHLVDELCNEVIDQQIRCDLDARCGKLKELIYDKAFAALRMKE